MAKLKGWEFWSTNSFKKDDGPMAPKDYENLKYDIIQRKGQLIQAGGGFLEITVNNSDLNLNPNDTRSQKYGGSKHRWQIVYAMYEKFRQVVLTAKIKYNFKRKKFKLDESIQLAKDKVELDKAVNEYNKNIRS